MSILFVFSSLSYFSVISHCIAVGHVLCEVYIHFAFCFWALSSLWWKTKRHFDKKKKSMKLCGHKHIHKSTDSQCIQINIYIFPFFSVYYLFELLLIYSAFGLAQYLLHWIFFLKHFYRHWKFLAGRFLFMQCHMRMLLFHVQQQQQLKPQYCIQHIIIVRQVMPRTRCTSTRLYYIIIFARFQLPSSCSSYLLARFSFVGLWHAYAECILYHTTMCTLYGNNQMDLHCDYDILCTFQLLVLCRRRRRIIILAQTIDELS